MKDWEQNPHLYLTDSEGSFILKKDGTPRKKGGRPIGATSNYQYSNEQKAKQASKRSLNKKRKAIEKIEGQLKSKKQALRQTTDILSKLENESSKPTESGQVVTEDKLSSLPKSVQAEIDKGNHVIFHANEGPQTDFLAADEKDVLYGGAAGGGKSYAMIVDPLRYAHKSAHRALILRRSMPELREMIDKSRELYPQAFPGAKFREVEKLWNFPSGAKVEFGFLERDADVYRYQGQAYSWIGFDEITHLPTEFS